MDETASHPPLFLDDVRSMPLDGGTKGVPLDAEPFELGGFATLGTSVDDLALPAMVLRVSALEHNLMLMADFCRAHGVDLAPHGKTTMAPQLWDRQLSAGAWGLTAATATQAQVMRSAGVRRIVIASQLVDEPSIRWVASQLDDPAVTIVCLVDSVEGVELLDAQLAVVRPVRPVPVLVEMGHAGGRTGVRSVADGVRVATRARASSHLDLAGVETFEGTVGTDRSPVTVQAVGALLDDLAALAVEVGRIGTFTDEEPMVVSAGGSAYFDLVIARLAGDRWGEVAVRILLRSGCYLTHDHGFYRALSPRVNLDGATQGFAPALELFGAVLSRPEPDLAIVGFGKRDAPFDLGMPIPLTLHSRSGEVRDLHGAATVEAMNDQHAYLRIDTKASIGVGDVLACGISHPCTAMDRWRVIPLIDDAGRVIDGVATFF